MAHYAHDVPYVPYPDISHSIPAPYPFPFPAHHLYPPHDDMPRPAFFSYSPDVIKHRKRTSRSQRKVLEDAFRQNPKPSQYTRKLLIHQTGMERRAIQVWFQNRRAKEKKLAAKAQQNAHQPNADPNAANLDANDDDDDDDKDSDDETKPGPSCSTDDELKPVPTSATSESAQITGATDLCDYTPAEDGSNQPTPSPQDSSTPAATMAGSNTNSSPGNSTNGISSPSPPSLWRASESSPAVNSNKGHLSAMAANVYAVRRESAPPAPLGADFPRVSPFLHNNFTRVGNDNNHTRVAVWDGGTPPSPLSASDDVINLSARRGSLPAFGSVDEHVSPNASRPLMALPPLPSDPSVRRMSLERSRMRLASHPYAPQVAAANRSFGMASHLGLPQEYGANYRHRPSLPHAVSAPSPSALVNPQQMHMLSANGSPQWDMQQPLLEISGETGANNFPSYIRPRRHGSYHGGPGIHNAPHRTITEIVPGPLPAPNFSFGTAPAAISENDGNEEDDGNAGTTAPMDEVHRFGSFASVTSAGSSATSAWYSDAQSNGLTSGNEELQTPPTWQSDLRRASCPAPFVTAFNGLHVNGEGIDPLGSQIHPSTDLGLTFDPAMQPDDPALKAATGLLGLEGHMTSKLHPMAGFGEPIPFYPDATFNPIPDEIHYSGLTTGYELPSEPVDSTPTSSNTPGVTYPYYN